MYAIIKTGGKQYRVQEGDVIKVEKLNGESDEQIEFNQVLAISKDDKISVGTPFLENAKVIGKVVEQGKSKKVIVLNIQRRIM